MEQPSRRVSRIIERVSLPLAIIVIVASAILSQRDLHIAKVARDQARSEATIIDDTNALLAAMMDAETGQRGYLLTGNPAYLVPYNNAVAHVRNQVVQLSKHAHEPDNAKRIPQITALVEAKLRELKQTIDIRQARGLTAALEVVQSDRGKLEMDQLRGLCKEVVHTSTVVYDRRVAEADASGSKVRLFSVIGPFCLLLLLIVATVTINEATARRRHLIRDLAGSREEAAQARDLFETTLRSIGDAVISTDIQGHVTFINGIAQKLTGWMDRTAIGLPLKQVFHVVNEKTRDVVESPLENVVRSGGIVGLARHTVLIAADGREIPIDDSAAPVRDSEGKMIGMVLVFRDVTERRRSELEIERQRMELERSNAALRLRNTDLQQFSYAVGHDLQEPLRTIASFSELVTRAERNNPDVREHVAFIQEGVRRMQALIRDLLAYARLAPGSRETKTAVKLDNVMTEVLCNLHAAIQESGATVTHDPLPAVIAQERQMVQLFQNFIGNAIKYRADRKPDIHISAEHDGHEWVFHVRDNGIGFEMKYAAEIFGVFKRLHARDAYSGTGIGLATCKRIVELHGGKVWAESEPGRGSTFSFTLPDEQHDGMPSGATGASA